MLNDIENEQSKNVKLISEIKELRARRNIIEHNNSIINHEYLIMSKKTNKKAIGKTIISSPDYVHQAYKNTISFLIIATAIILSKSDIVLDKVVCLIKKIKNASYELQLAKILTE